VPTGRRPQADAIAAAAANSRPGPHALDTRYDALPALKDLPLCPAFRFARDDRNHPLIEPRYRAHIVRAKDRAMDGMILPASSSRAATTAASAHSPKAFFMSEKSGFAKAEAIENE
jgi:hypothetical protein